MIRMGLVALAFLGGIAWGGVEESTAQVEDAPWRAGSSGPLRVIQSISAEPETPSPGEMVKIALDAPADFTVFTLSSPNRLVIDIPGAYLPGLSRTIDGPGGAILRVRASQNQLSPALVRVVLDLGEAAWGRALSSGPTPEIQVEAFAPGAFPVPTSPPAPAIPPAVTGPFAKVTGLSLEANPITPAATPGRGAAWGAARVVADLDRACAYRAFLLSRPPRVVIDLMGASIAVPLAGGVFERTAGASALIQRARLSPMRFGPRATGPSVFQWTRLVIDLNGIAPYRIRLEPATALSGGARLVVEVRPVPSPKGPVIIDPGHGGRETGARGPHGLREEDVNLAVALRVQDYLADAGVAGILTRSENVDVGLYDRALLANFSQADAFVSVHCNALGPRDGGTETYLTHPPGARLAKLIQDELVAALGRPDRGVKSARFIVTRETAMPSVLCELAFIDDPKEERLLADRRFQDCAAAAIARGIVRFLSGESSNVAQAEGER